MSTLLSLIKVVRAMPHVVYPDVSASNIPIIGLSVLSRIGLFIVNGLSG